MAKDNSHNSPMMALFQAAETAVNTPTEKTIYAFLEHTREVANALADYSVTKGEQESPEVRGAVNALVDTLAVFFARVPSRPWRFEEINNLNLVITKKFMSPAERKRILASFEASFARSFASDSVEVQPRLRRLHFVENDVREAIGRAVLSRVPELLAQRRSSLAVESLVNAYRLLTGKEQAKALNLIDQYHMRYRAGFKQDSNPFLLLIAHAADIRLDSTALAIGAKAWEAYLDRLPKQQAETARCFGTDVLMGWVGSEDSKPLLMLAGESFLKSFDERMEQNPLVMFKRITGKIQTLRTIRSNGYLSQSATAVSENILAAMVRWGQKTKTAWRADLNPSSNDNLWPWVINHSRSPKTQEAALRLYQRDFKRLSIASDLQNLLFIANNTHGADTKKAALRDALRLAHKSKGQKAIAQALKIAGSLPRQLADLRQQAAMIIFKEAGKLAKRDRQQAAQALDKLAAMKGSTKAETRRAEREARALKRPLPLTRAEQKAYRAFVEGSPGPVPALV